MTFRLFVYYCAMSGGAAAFVGWLLGRTATERNPVAEAGVKGLFLGMMVALALSMIDTVWNLSNDRSRRPLSGIAAAVVVGALGGLMAAMLGQVLYEAANNWIFLLIGWTLTGLLVGASLKTFACCEQVLKGSTSRASWQTLGKALLGGGAGGLLGGLLFVLLRIVWEGVFRDKTGVRLWSPSATGFTVLGMCIGLSIGLAQVILTEAWVRVEKGHRAGREILLADREITIGRAEGCDIGLFGGQGVERLHARIVRKGDGYYLLDAGTPGGTFVNDERIDQPTPLRQGDSIRIGNCTLSFGERRKRAAP